MEHEVQVAIIAAFGGIAIALVTAISAMAVARNTRNLAAHKAEVEELARKVARKAEVTALKLRVDQLEKENARLKRRIAVLDKVIRGKNNLDE